ncbi:MAG: hypothetical protein ACOC0W_08700 [Desulfosalsimonas sp.]
MGENIKTGLVMATYMEAKPFVYGIDWNRSAESPFPAYFAENLCLTISGMGKANAAAACAWMCTAVGPQCIVNLGAAGANLEGFSLGSLYRITQVFETDRLHFKTGEPFSHRPDTSGLLPGASLATRESPVMDPEDRRQTAYVAELSDMEGAAVVQAAARFATPCYVFKFVSDSPGHDTGDLIAANIRSFRDAVFAAALESVPPLSGIKIHNS